VSSAYDAVGSTWSKWDLHVHTPASIVHHYPGTAEEAWAAFIDDLEQLSPDFKVLGVNDYFFIDGYERLLEEKRNGKLSNIALLLPVLELRLNIFGGTDSKLRKVNAHVVFSEALEPDVIREQFISALASKFQLAPRHTELRGEWSGVLSRQALEDLGAAIIRSVPERERIQFRSPLEEGFSNLTVSLESVLSLLQNSYFAGRAIFGVGKTEWASVKWSDKAIADKKNVINKASLVFVASESPGAYNRARKALRDDGVNDRLLDCSDAHYLSTSSEKDRIGNANTWLKSSPSFGGLQQALAEFDQRVFVGEEPPELTRVREHPSRYIKRIRIEKVAGSQLPDSWFGTTELPFNSGLVVIIGNRGSGKSALAECIGLAGQSSREEDFSFLKSSKFREPKHNPAKHFRASLEWLDGSEHRTLLSDSPDAGLPPLVQHLPQQYLEKLCNDVPRGDKTEFDLEVERIIFAHLPTEDRMEASTLEERVELGSSARRGRLNECRSHLTALNDRIAEFEHRLRSANRSKVLEAYREARRDWYTVRHSPPSEVQRPVQTDPARVATLTKIGELANAQAHLAERIETTQQSLAEVRRHSAELGGFRSELERLERAHRQLLVDNGDLLVAAGLDSDVSIFTIDSERLDKAGQSLAAAEGELSRALDSEADRNLRSAHAHARTQIEELRKKLNAPEERYEEYRGRVEEWQEELKRVRGDSATPESALGKRAAWQALRLLPDKLASARTERRQVCRSIHELILGEVTEYGSLYERLEDHIAEAPVPSEYRLSVDTSLVDTGFTEGFLEERINRHAAGSFCGREESLKVVTELLDSTDLDDTESVLSLVHGIAERLHLDYRTEEQAPMEPSSQLRKGKTIAEVYDYIFGLSYLSPRYGLRFGSKPIHLLSPGEKGVLLLIFFLLAETNTRPLLIDQPEDNLDNQTVFKALVRCFHRAKTRRQVIIVTHNPNLAVVCDADQVIVATMDKEGGNAVSYRSGPIEEPAISQALLDVLEGTRPAFDNRSVKYELHTRSIEPSGSGPKT